MFQKLSLLLFLSFLAISSQAALFDRGGGITQYAKSTIFNYAWAVRDGDVVPIPAAVWLFGSGLIVLAGFARRKA